MSRWPVLIHDAIGITVAWLGAYWFRFNLDSIPGIFLDQAIAMLPVVIGAHLVFFVFFGIHRGAWRFTSTYDLWVVIKAVGVGTLVSAAVIFLLTDLIAVPRSVFSVARPLSRWFFSRWPDHVSAFQGSSTPERRGKEGDDCRRRCCWRHAFKRYQKKC